MCYSRVSFAGWSQRKQGVKKNGGHGGCHFESENSKRGENRANIRSRLASGSCNPPLTREPPKSRATKAQPTNNGAQMERPFSSTLSLSSLPWQREATRKRGDPKVGDLSFGRPEKGNPNIGHRKRKPKILSKGRPVLRSPSASLRKRTLQNAKVHHLDTYRPHMCEARMSQR